MYDFADEVKGDFVLLFDATHGKWMSSEARIAFGNGAKAFEQKYIDRHLCSYLIIPNIVIKTMLQGINLILRPKVPQIIFKTREQAESRLAKDIEEGVVLAGKVGAN